MIVGDDPLMRSEAVKHVWKYIRDNNLQTRKDKRRVKVDEVLEWIFPDKEEVSMFELTSLISEHLTPTNKYGDND